MTPWDAPPGLIEGTDGQAALGNKYIRKNHEEVGAAFETGRAKSREVVRDRQVRLLEEVPNTACGSPGAVSLSERGGTRAIPSALRCVGGMGTHSPSQGPGWAPGDP